MFDPRIHLSVGTDIQDPERIALACLHNQE